MSLLFERSASAHARILRRWRDILAADPLLDEEVDGIRLYYARQLLYQTAPSGRAVALLIDRLGGERQGTTQESETRIYLGIVDSHKAAPTDDEVLWAWEIADHLGALAAQHHQLIDDGLRLTDGLVRFEVAAAPIQVSGQPDLVILEAAITWASTLKPTTRQPLQ